jgi:hypothetical protein
VLSSILAQSKSAERKGPVLPIFVNIPLSTDRRDTHTPKGRSARHLRDYNSPSSLQFCASPPSRLACHGWCMPDPNVKAPTVVSFFSMLYALCTQAQRLFMYIQVSLAACSDDQRSWEAHEGSLTRVVCNFLGKPTRLHAISSL